MVMFVLSEKNRQVTVCGYRVDIRYLEFFF
jgi:hypothetical protein